jgi:hypothetical protein
MNLLFEVGCDGLLDVLGSGEYAPLRRGGLVECFIESLAVQLLCPGKGKS